MPELQFNPFRDRICAVFSTADEEDGSMCFEDFLDMASGMDASTLLYCHLAIAFLHRVGGNSTNPWNDYRFLKYFVPEMDRVSMRATDRPRESKVRRWCYIIPAGAGESLLEI